MNEPPEDYEERRSRESKEWLKESLAKREEEKRARRWAGYLVTKKEAAEAPLEELEYGKNLGKFAESTIDATLYLIRSAPERLEGWYARHPPGLAEEVAKRLRGRPNDQKSTSL